MELVGFDDMILELVDFFDKYNKRGRKGYEGEGIVWILKRLRTQMGMPSKDEIAKSIAAEILEEKKKPKPKQDPKRVKAAKKAAHTRKRNAAAKEKKRKAAEEAKLREKLNAAAEREAKQEADVDVELDRLLGVYSNASRTVVLIVYVGRVVAGVPAGRAEALDARLFAPDALPELAFDHDARILADLFRPDTSSQE